MDWEERDEPEQGLQKVPTLRLNQNRQIGRSEFSLRIISGPDTGKKFPVLPFSTRMMIGTATDNDLVLTDPAVSRHHAELSQTEESFLLKDLGSTNGSFVEGVQVQDAHVSLYSRIRLGRTEIQIVPDKSEQETTDTVFAGKHPRVREILETVDAVANSPLTVLITGETGTGKELIARAIHVKSDRRDLPFVVLDCSTIPEHLMESELFGHEKGAFTGATAARKGAFEQAQGGTIFLDEIGELNFQLQPKLLRVLDRHEVKKVGSSTTIPVNVRVLAATNRDLRQEIKQGIFRGDLYYRLAGIEIPLPSLRERREDIPVLIEHFVHQIGSRKRFSQDALQLLVEFNWPGNVRQLRNVVERALLLCKSEEVEPESLQAFLPISGKTNPPAGTSLLEMEKTAIVNMLKITSGNKMEAARRLGIAYSTLFEKMKKYGL